MRVEKLGAHLEAYIQTLPTIVTLRLCSRFGSRPQCHINKLPIELVGTIEEHIIESACAEALGTWSLPTNASRSNAIPSTITSRLKNSMTFIMTWKTILVPEAATAPSSAGWTLNLPQNIVRRY